MGDAGGEGRERDEQSPHLANGQVGGSWDAGGNELSSYQRAFRAKRGGTTDRGCGGQEGVGGDFGASGEGIPCIPDGDPPQPSQAFHLSGMCGGHRHLSAPGVGGRG